MQRSLQTPVGQLIVSQDGEHICGLRWGRRQFDDRTPLLDEAAAQITAYFDSRLQRFNLPMAAQTSPLVHLVLEALFAIRYGETTTYGDVAKRVEAPAQAVGQALGANPLPILIPCHRVLGSDSLGGFSGGLGIETKVWLLRHEGAAGLLI